MATKNLVPRGDQEGKLGLENRRWLGINAKSGKFLDIQSDELKNSQNNDLLIAGDGISISYVNNEDGNNGAQYTISSTSSGNSNAQVDRIFAGPNDANGSPTQQQAVIAGFDENNSTLNKLTFKTNGIDRWFIDNNGHYIPEGTFGELDIGNGTNYVRYIIIYSHRFVNLHCHFRWEIHSICIHIGSESSPKLSHLIAYFHRKCIQQYPQYAQG